MTGNFGLQTARCPDGALPPPPARLDDRVGRGPRVTTLIGGVRAAALSVLLSLCAGPDRRVPRATSVPTGLWAAGLATKSTGSATRFAGTPRAGRANRHGGYHA